MVAVAQAVRICLMSSRPWSCKTSLAASENTDMGTFALCALRLSRDCPNSWPKGLCMGWQGRRIMIRAQKEERLQTNLAWLARIPQGYKSVLSREGCSILPACDVCLRDQACATPAALPCSKWRRRQALL